MSKLDNQQTVYYFTPHGPFGMFSNFYHIPIIIDDKKYNTVEHYFQSQKSPYPKMQEEIRKCSTPQQAKSMGSSIQLRRDWEQCKENVMMKALRAKAYSSVEFRELLLSTGTREIVENNPYDSYWGTGSSGYGKNRMGKLLMRLREELRK